MPRSTDNSVRHLIRRAMGASDDDTDAELLRRFRDARDGAAFEALVRRHGPMVCDVCRAALPNPDDADDAFQSTFLVLAARAHQVRDPAALAGWLHGVAHRVACRARTAFARRHKHEPRAAAPARTGTDDDELTWREVRQAIHEELAALAERYRVPLALCYLQGRTQEEAAALAGVARSTLKERLERGRELLRARLVRRGLGPVVLVLAAWPAAASEGVPPELVSRTVRAAQTGAAPADVAALTEGAVRAMGPNMLKVAAGLLCGCLAIGSVVLGARAATPDREAVAALPVPPPPPVAPLVTAAAPVPKDAEFEKKVSTAREKAIRYLIDQQGRDGTWEAQGFSSLEGGQTALVLLALLEAGVPANDPNLAKGLAYLAELEPKRTYVVGLQAQVLARADAKKYAKQVQACADWLLANAIHRDEKLAGWSYADPGAGGGDNSNTHFAVMGLHAAARAGAKVKPEVWKQLRDYYARTQRRDGRWGYTEDGGTGTTNMTAVGLLALAVATSHDKGAKGPDPAFEKGLKSLLADDRWGGKSDGYLWFTTAELGRALGTDTLKVDALARAWYREGVEVVSKGQQDNGSWKGKDGTLDASQPVVSTAFALFVLGPPRK